MKLWVIQEIGYEYNDEYWFRSECEGGKPVTAFKVRDNADAACRRMNAEKAESDSREGSDGESLTDFYEVIAVDVADDDVEGYASARAAVEAAVQAAKDAGQKEFHRGTTALFESHPELQSFSWTQYTPYFNDGEECVFGVNVDDPDINGIEGYEINKGWGDHPPQHPELLPVKEAVEKFLSQFAESDMKSIFGDHVCVVVTPAGVEVAEHEHD